MSVIYCDFCNHYASANDWDGSYLPATNEAICSQCEFDGILDESDIWAGTDIILSSVNHDHEDESDYEYAIQFMSDN